jgi:hypothetical protein
MNCTTLGARLVKIAVFAGLMASASAASARCKLPRDYPSTEEVASYITKYADFVALTRKVGDRRRDDSYRLKVVVPFKGPSDVEYIELVPPRLSQRLIREMESGTLTLVALKFGGPDHMFKENECLSLALSRVPNDDLINRIYSATRQGSPATP